jgi:hypothetical protein
MFDLNQWRTVNAAFLSKTEANLVCTWQSDLELDKEIFISDQKSCSPKIKLAISPGPVSASHLILKASTDVCLGRERIVDIKINTK